MGDEKEQRCVRNSDQLRQLIKDISEGVYVSGSMSEISDAELVSWAEGARGEGYRNAVASLVQLHPALRSLAVSEGNITMNMSPGWRFSGAVAYGAREIAAGRCSHIEMNQAVIANDKYGFKAAEAASRGVSHDAYLEQITGRRP